MEDWNEAIWPNGEKRVDIIISNYIEYRVESWLYHIDEINLNNFTLNSCFIIIHYNDDSKRWSQNNGREL